MENEKAVMQQKKVNKVWLIILAVVVVVIALGWWKINQVTKEPELGMAEFLVLASPIENVQQTFSIGRHEMPSLRVLPELLEIERVNNPSLTGAQLQRAKWMERAWISIHRRNESRRQVGKQPDGMVDRWAVNIVQKAMGKERREEVMDGLDIAELSNLQVMVGNDVIPSLVSGLLPVFSDAETLKYRTELFKQKLPLNELDMRRAKFFQTKYGAGTVPAKAIDDIEMRKDERMIVADRAGGEEALQKAINSGYFKMPAGDPLTENERLELACGVLNALVATPAAAPVAQ